MSTRSVVQTETAEQAVLEANRHFYQAFAALDLEKMESVWLHEDWVQCVHPGWDLMLGWEEVRASWTRIFAGTQRIKIEIRSVWVRVEGDVAWVACTQDVTSTFESGFDQVLVQATNIFVRRPVPPESAAAGTRKRAATRWYIVAHHASPLPTTEVPTLQ